VALIDLSLPDGAGLELARRLAADPAGPKPVLLVPLGTAQPAERVRESGCRVHLFKPVRTAALVRVLRTLLVDKPEEPAQSVLPLSMERAPRRAERILVVDDVPVNQRLMLAILEKRGFAADIAGSGVEAVEAVSRTPYDLVLMDCHMPEMDGFDATRSIRQRETQGKRLAIVALTGGSQSTERDQCIEAGMDDYLSKPIMEDALDAALSRWLPSAGIN
jgi:two-component system sensor histidine kinase/response regulator